MEKQITLSLANVHSMYTGIYRKMFFLREMIERKFSVGTEMYCSREACLKIVTWVVSSVKAG